MGKERLPEELRSLVRESVAVLGEVIRRELGESCYERIESIRKKMAGLRGRSAQQAYTVLSEVQADLRALSFEERCGIAHSFTLMLELMNACENAYRSHRVRQRPNGERLRSKGPEALIYVLTAHPTESRSPRNIEIFHQIQRHLLEVLEKRRDQTQLKHLLELAWHAPVSRKRRPTVEDEAEHIYSIGLREESLGALLSMWKQVGPVYLRSWVGGDKDGHPGVDELTFQRSLQLSRRQLYRQAQRLLSDVRKTLALIEEPVLLETIAEVFASLRRLRILGRKDGSRVRGFRRKLGLFGERYLVIVGANHPSLEELRLLLRMFPALVIPLELRESSELVLAALRDRKVSAAAISRMLRALAGIAEGGDPRWYARGLIISMASSIDQIRAGAELVKRELRELRIPVIPLFEQREHLQDAHRVVLQMTEDREIRAAVDRHWGGFLEIMVGYSDSAKEVGVLASRVELEQALYRVDRVCRKKKVKPLFFHGSGGSVDRGGGSIEEQTAWWPKSALNVYKVTVQGEMVERAFASAEIIESALKKTASQARKSLGMPENRIKSEENQRVLLAFSDRVRRHYQRMVRDPLFLQVVQQATPYRYLNELRLGSRPSARTKSLTIGSLRAIPWVLCWTQTRVLFPTWWGIGSSWREASEDERKALKSMFGSDPLFSSFVKLLAFSLAKIELPIWRIYLESSGLEQRIRDGVYLEFQKEYDGCLAFVRALSGEPDLLWYRPWLGESIRLRSPMIHPLNLLQIISFSGETGLLRETVAGIASGMLTTG